MIIDYRKFIQENFTITTTDGRVVPFIFNSIQNYYYDLIIADHGPELNGVRENILKSRRFGFSSIIDAIFMTDFILGELGEIPVTNSDVYSYRQTDTTTLFTRVNQFLDSWLLKSQGGNYADFTHRTSLPKLRSAFLSQDKTGTMIAGMNGSEYHCLTAGAKVAGRGGTKQNIHWSEVAFYNNTAILNAKALIAGVEEQVTGGIGKIFRETTGNTADDFFGEEYQLGVDGESDFVSRFLAWYLMEDYKTKAPEDWVPPFYYDSIRQNQGVTVDQCYWHYLKTRALKSKLRMREYPTTDTEAFLYGGDPFFEEDALLLHMNAVRKPLMEADYVLALQII